MTVSILLAVLGSLCGVVPYLAVSQFIIQICGQIYDISLVRRWVIFALLGYLGSTWLGTTSTMFSHRSAFTILKKIRTELTEKLFRVPMGYIFGYDIRQIQNFACGYGGKTGTSAGTHDPGTDSEYPRANSDVGISFCLGLAPCIGIHHYESYWPYVLLGRGYIKYVYGTGYRHCLYPVPFFFD